METSTTRGCGALKKKAAVMARLVRLVARGKHEKQGWHYLTGDDLRDALRPLMAEAGLVHEVIPASVEARQQEQKKDESGKQANRALVRVGLECALVDVETGDRCDAGTWWAEAYDQGDKTQRSCESMALAAFLESAFLVTSSPAPRATGEGQASGERARDTGPAEGTPAAHKARISAWARKHSWNALDEIQQRLGLKGKALDLEPADLARVVAAIEAQAAAPTGGAA